MIRVILWQCPNQHSSSAAVKYQHKLYHYSSIACYYKFPHSILLRIVLCCYADTQSLQGSVSDIFHVEKKTSAMIKRSLSGKKKYKKITVSRLKD